MSIEEKEFDLCSRVLNEAIEATKNVLHPVNGVGNQDWMGQMLVSFMFKQLDHAMSVLALGSTKDSMLIARTMIEGMIYICYANQNIGTVPKKWNDYTYVATWKRMIETKENGSFDPNDEKAILEKFYAEGRQFLLKDRGHIDVITSKPADYHKSFLCGQNINQIAESLKKTYPFLKELYWLYGYCSDWAHWGSESIKNVTRKNFNEINYYENEYTFSQIAFRAAILSLLSMANLFSDHFKLGQESELADILQQFSLEVS